METLYSLTADCQALMEYADSTDPEDAQVFLDTLEGMKGTIGAKIDSYHAVQCQIRGQIEVVEDEIRRLTVRKKALQNSDKRMTEAAIKAIELIGDTDKNGNKFIKTDLHTFKIQNNGGVLPLIVDGNVPDNFKRVVYEDDNQKIREALERGEVLGFAHLGERGVHLAIR